MFHVTILDLELINAYIYMYINAKYMYDALHVVHVQCLLLLSLVMSHCYRHGKFCYENVMYLFAKK